MAVRLRKFLKFWISIVVLTFFHAVLERGLLPDISNGYFESLGNSWTRARDNFVEALEWLDSFLPESIYENMFFEENVEPIYVALLNASGVEEASNHFANSRRPRRWRTSAIFFRVGDVVLILRDKIFCVVAGWDKKGRAPQYWFDMVYAEEERKRKIDQPHYLGICEQYEEDNLYYVPQEEIVKVENVEVVGPKIKKLFTIEMVKEVNHTELKYIPVEWLRKLYPSD